MAQVGNPAHLVDAVLQAQVVGHGDLVDGLSPLEEGQARLETVAVPLAVEVVRLEEVGYLDQGVAIQKEGADHRLLRRYVVGEQPIRVHVPACPSTLSR